MADEAQQRIEAYLERLRGHLRGMNEAEVREIVEELRGHILDKTALDSLVTVAGVDAALAKLGTPEGLAAEYLTCEVLARAEVSRSPLRILDSLFRWASLSFAGFWVLLGTVVGYFVGFAVLLCALLKPFHPHTAGLWLIPGADGPEYSLRLGFASPPPGAHEVLGHWMVPLGLIVGTGLIILTTRFALWCARAYRRSRSLPRR